MTKKILLSLFIFSGVLLAQTKIQPSQLNLVVNILPPTTTTFFAIENQVQFFLAPGTNPSEIVKVEVYRNGILQTDVGNERVKRDYSLSADLRTINFESTSKPEIDDIIRVLVWHK